ncbi:MAG TPA: ATP-binding protein [Streptosporangiaceae bacterium]|nr:ATP-binding protein [Streptosporangiaceae bacterium]
MREAESRSGQAPAGSPWAAPGEAVAFIQLPALPVTPRWARRHAQAVLGAWFVPPDVAETALLLVSELVTNSVAALARHAGPEAVAAGLIEQTLRRKPGRLVIEVSDPDPNPPVVADADLEADNGRGLILVQALSKEWSYFFPPSGGKTIYFVLGISEIPVPTDNHKQ